MRKALSLFFGCVTAVSAAACHRDSSSGRVVATSSPDQSTETTSAAPIVSDPQNSPAAGADECGLATNVAKIPGAPRVIAIGDLHGDLAATRAVLKLAGAIDSHDTWIGGSLVLVQTGDLLDRGDDEQAIVDLFERLEREATATGGALVWLLGNHECMNAAHDFRYVTQGGVGDFDDAPGVDTSRVAASVPEVLRGRVAALSPGGAYARIMAGQNVGSIVGDTVFAHAGFTPQWATRFDEANHTARCWMAGRAGEAPPEAITDEDGPVWTRAWGGDSVDCAALKQSLTKLGVSRMVVGHTVQADGINSQCDGALWRIDVGLSRYYQGSTLQVLEVTDGATKILSTARPAP